MTDTSPTRVQLDAALARIAHGKAGADEADLLRRHLAAVDQAALAPAVERARDLAEAWRQYGGQQMRTAARLLDQALAGDGHREPTPADEGAADRAYWTTRWDTD